MDIKIENLTKAYGNEMIYRDFSIKFPENKITGIMGPSGSGKTTLLTFWPASQLQTAALLKVWRLERFLIFFRRTAFYPGGRLNKICALCWIKSRNRPWHPFLKWWAWRSMQIIIQKL